MKRGSIFRMILIGSFLCSFAQAAEYEQVCPFAPSTAGQQTFPLTGYPMPKVCMSCEKKAGAQSASMSCGQKNMSYCEYNLHCKYENPNGGSLGYNPFNNMYGGMAYGMGGLEATKMAKLPPPELPKEWDSIVRCEPNRDGSCPSSKECYTKKNISPYSLEGQVINDYSKKEGVR